MQAAHETDILALALEQVLGLLDEGVRSQVRALVQLRIELIQYVSVLYQVRVVLLPLLLSQALLPALLN